MNYSEKVISLIKESKISAYSFSKHLDGASGNTVAGWLRRTSVPCKFAVQIADHFEVDLRSLQDDEMEIVSLKDID